MLENYVTFNPRPEAGVKQTPGLDKEDGSTADSPMSRLSDERAAIATPPRLLEGRNGRAACPPHSNELVLSTQRMAQIR